MMTKTIEFYARAPMCRALTNPNIQITEFFMSMPPCDIFTKTDIANHTGLHRHTVSKSVETLLFFEIIEPIKKIGNVVLYKLSDNDTTTAYISLMEKINYQWNHKICDKCHKEFRTDKGPLLECSHSHITCYDCEDKSFGVCPVCAGKP